MCSEKLYLHSVIIADSFRLMLLRVRFTATKVCLIVDAPVDVAATPVSMLSDDELIKFAQQHGNYDIIL